MVLALCAAAAVLLTSSNPRPALPGAPLRQGALLLPAVDARPVYRHSVVPGGVFSAAEVADAVAHDPVVAAHYAAVDLGRLVLTTLDQPRDAFVSYRVGDRTLWTARKVRLPKGEAVLTDGEVTLRARCGNLVSDEAVAGATDERFDPAGLDLEDSFGIGRPRRATDAPQGEVADGAGTAHVASREDGRLVAPWPATGALPSLMVVPAVVGYGAGNMGGGRTGWSSPDGDAPNGGAFAGGAIGPSGAILITPTTMDGRPGMNVPVPPPDVLDQPIDLPGIGPVLGGVDPLDPEPIGPGLTEPVLTGPGLNVPGSPESGSGGSGPSGLGSIESGPASTGAPSSGAGGTDSIVVPAGPTVGGEGPDGLDGFLAQIPEPSPVALVLVAIVIAGLYGHRRKRRG